MCKNLRRCIACAVVTLLVLCFSVSVPVLASEPAISADFENGSNGFLAPGDLNSDGNVNALDLVMLRLILLTSDACDYDELCKEIGSDAKFSDANGDSSVNILDLVRVKKCVDRIFIESDGGVNGTAGMNVYGNVSYSGGLSSVLTKDRYYKLSFSYKSDEPLKFTINGISAQKYVFNTSASSDWKTETYIFGTAEDFTSISDIEMQICGSGIVDNIAIVPCTIDNDLPDIW